MAAIPLTGLTDRAQRIAAILVAVLFVHCPLFALGDSKAADGAGQDMAKGEEMFSAGMFEDAILRFQHAAAVYQRRHDHSHYLEAIINLAKGYHASGQLKAAIPLLQEAEKSSEAAKDPRQAMRIEATLGAIYTLSRKADLAAPMLEKSLASARQLKDRPSIAHILNDVGNLRASQQKHAEAIDAYRECIGVAEEIADPLLAAKACANLADSAAANGDLEMTKKYAGLSAKKAEGLPPSHDLAFLFIHLGSTHDRLSAQENRERLQALNAYEKAAGVAESIGDQRAVSYALGGQAELYEAEHKYEDALRLSRKAAFFAQQVRSQETLYKWEWQTGRILRAQKKYEPALDAYRRAIDTLQSVRHDVAIRYGNRNVGSSFREAVGPMFFEMADLLLKKADATSDQAEVQALLKYAVSTAELLKAAELEDYFQDDCVNLRRSKTRGVENISPSAAIIYIIPLADRTEIVLSMHSGFQRVRTKPASEELTQTVREFRLNLEKRFTQEYLEQSWKLYDWLIRPIEGALKEKAIDTLVFVPDGALRTVPMAALHDGKKFLVEKYAIAVTPGAELMEATPIAKENATMMLNALTQGVQGYDPLEFVGEEVANLKKLYSGRTLIDKQFVFPDVQKEFAKNEYSIVHIASHGHFDRDARESYVLTFDGKLSLDQLEQLFRPSALRDQPVELLTLSACETAAGDDRAALGLGGIAVKAGARSALATLWCVNDQASSELVSSFYTQLKKGPDVSKAKALRTAQMELISQPQYAHPCYWAPYLIIGNWL